MRAIHWFMRWWFARASRGSTCAGGDLVEMAALADRDMEAAEKALADEIALVWRAECFTKPTVALIDGAVIGGGNEISRFGTHRVAGENYRFAMPETGLGLFPNNGLAHTFARMPKDIGMYLALTGDSVGPADAPPPGPRHALHRGGRICGDHRGIGRC